MILNEPSDYQLVLSEGSYALLRNSKPSKFTAPASTPGVAKLYTLSSGSTLFYVGISQQRISSRLGYGFRANGETGYFGYKWKGLKSTLHLSVWTAQVNSIYAGPRELETTEAEVAFLCRQQSGQWPMYQHEIHFYPSTNLHRDAAARIYNHAIRKRG